MSRRVASVLARVVLVTLLVTLGFALLQEPVRVAEMTLAAATLDSLGAGEHLRLLGSSVAVLPPGRTLFLAVLTPSCSSLASVLAVLSLGVLLPKAPTGRRVVAVLAAAATVVIGNLVRILLSLVVGLLAGRASLVLFHDVAGAAFTFLYVLAGYVLMLTLLLPKRGDHPPTTGAVLHVP